MDITDRSKALLSLWYFLLFLCIVSVSNVFRLIFTYIDYTFSQVLVTEFPPFWERVVKSNVTCSFCCYFIVCVCLSRWCWGLNVDLIVSVPEFSDLLYLSSPILRSSFSDRYMISNVWNRTFGHVRHAMIQIRLETLSIMIYHLCRLYSYETSFCLTDLHLLHDFFTKSRTISTLIEIKSSVQYQPLKWGDYLPVFWKELHNYFDFETNTLFILAVLKFIKDTNKFAKFSSRSC